MCRSIRAAGKSCLVIKDSCIPEDIQCAIILGGDGTFIQAANDLIRSDIPMLGVNLGTLGFLTEIEKQNIPMALEHLYRDECSIESRMMIKGSILCGEKSVYEGYALNDIVINRSGMGHLISVGLYVNRELIDTYIGDGIIVSTPTGSTGYNLSAGGPIMNPKIKAVVISPICPHSLNKRSLVVSSDDEILLKIGCLRGNQPDNAAGVFDGRQVGRLISGDSIVIREAEVETKIVKLFDINFYEILRSKLGRERSE